jgi:hypothetical protein
MRRLFLAVLGVVAVTGVASAQQPIYQQPPIAPPAYSPGAVAAAPVQPASGATVIKGNGCSNCGPTVASSSRGFTMSKLTGGNCLTGDPCQNGCGSVKSDLAFHFGSCKSFFSPCGPSLGGHGKGGLFGGGRCPTVPFAEPWGQGWGCPRAYDSYANH